MYLKLRLQDAEIATGVWEERGKDWEVREERYQGRIAELKSRLVEQRVPNSGKTSPGAWSYSPDGRASRQQKRRENLFKLRRPTSNQSHEESDYSYTSEQAFKIVKSKATAEIKKPVVKAFQQT